MTTDTLPLPIDLTPETAQLLAKMETVLTAITQLHPILDLLEPERDPEGHGMLLQLYRLLMDVEEMMAARQGDRDRMTARLGRLEDQMARIDTMLTDLHGILMQPLQD